MTNRQSNINRTTTFFNEVVLGTAICLRLISQLFTRQKEIFTTGFEMTTVVFGGDVNSLLQNRLVHLTLNGESNRTISSGFPPKNKWVFS